MAQTLVINQFNIQKLNNFQMKPM